MAEKLIRWLIFNVIIALLPIFWNILKIMSHGNVLSLSVLCSNGELLLVSSAIAAASIGKVIASGRKKSISKIISGGGCVVLLSLSSLWFADIASANSTSNPINPETVASGSIIMFIFTIIASASCIMLAEVR